MIQARAKQTKWIPPLSDKVSKLIFLAFSGYTVNWCPEYNSWRPKPHSRQPAIETTNKHEDRFEGVGVGSLRNNEQDEIELNEMGTWFLIRGCKGILMGTNGTAGICLLPVSWLCHSGEDGDKSNVSSAGLK